MKPISYLFKRESACKSLLRAVWVCALLQVVVPAWADNLFLTPGKIDGVALLPPPPVVGSAEGVADLASARSVFKGRSQSEELRAMKDASLSLYLFEPAIGPFFKPGKLPKLEALWKQVRTEAGSVIEMPKKHWQRQRPYQLDSQLSFGEPEPSFSYPSGHSTRGTVYSLVLAEVFPEQREAILAIGRNIGWDRVLIGKHFITDVFAGRVLGKAIMRELMSNPVFQRDLAEAKLEAQAVAASAMGR